MNKEEAYNKYKQPFKKVADEFSDELRVIDAQGYEVFRLDDYGHGEALADAIIHALNTQAKLKKVEAYLNVGIRVLEKLKIDSDMYEAAMIDLKNSLNLLKEGKE